MTAAAAPSRPSGPLRRLDDAIFGIEQRLVALFLSLITLGTFADVVQRRLVAPDSKVGELLARISGTTDPAARAMLDHQVAPVVSVALLFALLLFAWMAAERDRPAPFLPFRGSALVLAVSTCVGLGVVAWLMLSVPSSWFTLGFGTLALGAYAQAEARARTAGWGGRVAGAVVGLAVLAWFCFVYVPEGYGWGKELAMLLTLWVGFFGASICVHEGKHIRLEALERTHPEAAAHLIAALGHVVAALFAAFLAYLGALYLVAQQETGGTLSQTGLPDWVMTAVVPVAFGLAALRSVAAAVSALRGGSYGKTAKAEGMEEAERMAAEAAEASAEASASVTSAPKPRPPPLAFGVVVVIIVLAALLGGNTGRLVAVILFGALLSLPLYVVLGLVVVACFVLFQDGYTSLDSFTGLIEQIRGLADAEALLAIPLFILSGAIMGKGQISQRLIGFARALVGWLPGGLAISAVIACMIFAAISGSSPATVVAIGGVMAPALIQGGYPPKFAHGLVTSAGSLGILIPPSIPMIVYAIVNTSSPIRVEDLFAAGYGPGLVIGGILGGYSLYRGIVDRTPRDAFDVGRLWTATRDGFWSLLFPFFIFVGTNTGIFTAVEAAGASVVYATLVELFIHRAITVKDLFAVFQEVGVMLGSFLVILVIAKSFGEFLVYADVPVVLTDWITGMHLTELEFLLALNLLLLVVGCLMDIMSAIFVFVPLIAPMAASFGIDPLHLGIIFIVNLEIGYLTPPVGLNLFVSSTLFGKPLGYVVRSVAPFIVMMMGGLLVITYYPPLSGDLGRWITGSEPWVRSARAGEESLVDDDHTPPVAAPACDPPEDLDCDGNVTMEEMTEFASRDVAPSAAAPACDPPEDLNCDGNVTMEEMTEFAMREPEAPAAPTTEEPPMASLASLRAERDRLASLASPTTEPVQIADPLPDLEALVGSARADVTASLGEGTPCTGGLCEAPGAYYSFYRLPEGWVGGGPELILAFAADDTVSSATWRRTQ